MLNELYASLVRCSTLPRGLVMPGVQFFKPNEAFNDWMLQTCNGRLVYDVGAGCGQVAQQLKASGILVKALDIHRRDGAQHPVVIADGASYPYEAGSIVMLCRPCHGLFTQAVIEQAIYRSVFSILYVGLAGNLKDDLGKYRSRFKRVLTKTGRDGENIYQYTRERWSK